MTPALPRRIILGFLLGGLLVLSFLVLRMFIVPIVWAIILAYVTWPLYVRVRRLLRNHAVPSAFLMTIFLITCFVLPVLWLVGLVRGELASTYTAIANFLSQGPHDLPDFISQIPFFGIIRRIDGHFRVQRRMVRQYGGTRTRPAGTCAGTYRDRRCKNIVC